MRLTVVCLLLVLASVIMLAQVPRIDAWEKARSYPYGRICHSILSLGKDTCRVAGH